MYEEESMVVINDKNSEDSTEKQKSKETNLSEQSYVANLIIDSFPRFSWILLSLILLFGWYSPVLMIISLVCMIGPIVFSFSFGRGWCGNFCPRNSFNSVVLSIISPNMPIPRFFKDSLFRIVMFVLLMLLLINNLYHSNGTLLGIGLAIIKMMAITVLIQICLAILIHPYTWCTFCPMGTVAYFIAKAKGGTINNIKVNTGCISCGACKQNCPIQIDISDWKCNGEVKDLDCMKCRKCIKNCSQKCLKYGE